MQNGGKKTAPDARLPLDMIATFYAVEHDVRNAGLLWLAHDLDPLTYH